MQSAAAGRVSRRKNCLFLRRGMRRKKVKGSEEGSLSLSSTLYEFRGGFPRRLHTVIAQKQGGLIYILGESAGQTSAANE